MKHGGQKVFQGVFHGETRKYYSYEIEGCPEAKPDITDTPDRFNPEMNMSVLSGFSYDSSANMPFYFSKGTGLCDEYEERLAISEYNGLQNSTQAQRIAYLDAFLAVLATLPYEDVKGDWLSHKIKTTQKWLMD